MDDGYRDRTCTVVVDKEGVTNQTLSRPLSDFRHCDAYVLLAAPGAGKTEAFKHEAGEQRFCDARDFITLSSERWSNVTPLFIDALDEMRAGSADRRTPLDAIRQKLDQLKRPRFRLSCREVDWFGVGDQQRLESVSPDGFVTVLRLDPLTDDDVRAILSRYPDITHPDGFMDKARERRLDSLLANPKSLEMLVRAVAARKGAWPDSLTETFGLACRELVGEHNKEHRIAKRNRPNITTLLDTAGFLCAVQLLTGSAGYDPIDNKPAQDHIGLDELTESDEETLRLVLDSKLFRPSGNNCTIPVHRHVAEFLGGRYLSGLVDGGLPVRRVLALLTGEDGRTISALRGLTAWFAAHCKAARDQVIERDPLATVLYGDVRGFTVAEKRFLLSCLEKDAERDPGVFGAMHDLDSRWQDLATPDMEKTFQEILTTAEGSQGKQTVALAVLQSLQRGSVIPRLTPMLLDIVRNNECWSTVRDSALTAHIRQSHDPDHRDGELQTLLTEVHAGSVSDPDDQLLGLLLMELYPRVVPPVEVGRYLREPRMESLIGWYSFFWKDAIAEQSTDNQLAEVLNSLLDTYRERGWTREDSGALSYWLRTIPVNLLATYLDRSPTVENKSLFAWLGLAGRYAHVEDKISNWLHDNPDSYKALVRLAADRHENQSQIHEEIFLRLHFAVEPSDFGAWCLTQAALTETNTAAAKEFFLCQAIARQDHEGISDEVVENRLAHDSSLVAEYKERRRNKEHEASKINSKQTELKRQRETEAKQRRKEWHDLVKAHESELRENRAAPGLLHRLASAYLGRFVDVQGPEGRSRLHDLLNDDNLVELVIQAFRASTTRADLPNMADIFRLADEREHHLLMLPFLVGLDELPSHRPGEVPLDEQGMSRALAFRFNAPDFWKQEPDWYRDVLKSRPDLVADVLVRSVRANLRRGENSGLGLHELYHDNDYLPIAEIAVTPLLKSFPTRHKIEQLHVLKVLLRIASRHINRHDLSRIIEGKLALRSMDAAQRMYWTCAGLLAKPTLFTERLREKLAGGGHERRVRHVAEFLYDRNDSSIGALGVPVDPSIDVLDVPALELVIRSLGNSYRPYGWADNNAATARAVARKNRDHTSFVVDGLINTLASKTSHNATKALERLSEENTLRPWQFTLRDALSRQRAVHREADFRHPTVEQVLGTLDNRRPANAADLAALTVDSLGELAKTIRHGNTSDWRQYWNVDPPKHPKESRPEDECRNHLLSDLRRMLAPLEVDAQPEGTYADDKRADIRVSCDAFNVPVEIKKSEHSDLWTAIRRQLIAKYTRDPGCDGYGIYLVFWFGRDRCKRPPDGPVPQDPAALRDQLLATAKLSAEERRKISVCVIDVSKPEPQSDGPLA